MKIYIKVSGIIIVILISLILLKYVHIIVGVTFFVIGIGLLVYYGFIKYNSKIVNYIRNGKKPDNTIVIGSEGMGSWSKGGLDYIFHIAFPDMKIVWENTYDCDIVVKSFFVDLEPLWVKTIKPYIYWSGEPKSVDVPKNINKYLRIDTMITNYSEYMPLLFCCFGKDITRSYTNKNRPFLVAYCNSNKKQHREDMFNILVEKGKDVHSLGKNYGKYKKTQRKVEGNHTSQDLLKTYSQYNFVFAMENEKQPGYISEKILNAFLSGAIPIFWGDSDTASQFFNKSSYIDVSDFSTYEECSNYIVNMKKEQIDYMMDQDIIRKPIDERIHKFNNNSYYEKIASKIEEIYIENSVFTPIIDLYKDFDWSKIDGIIYINLDHRLDRKRHIESQLNKIGIPQNKITRLSATKHEIGYIGCAHSHMRACQLAIDNDWKNVLIFEDDFEFIVNKKTVNKLLNALFNYVDNWDGVVLSSSQIKKEHCIYSPFLYKNLGSVTMSGYLINKNTMYLLRDSNKLSYDNLMKGKKQNDFACDVIWQKIQKNNNWYCFNPKFGKQIESYSDIEKKIVNYEKLEK